MKKIISFVLSCMIIFSILPLPVMAADATASGTAGNMTWTLEGDTLTISGTGDMPDWTWEAETPWDQYRYDISNIIIGNGITSIGNSAFDDCSNLTSITIPSSITSIGAYAFGYCSGLENVYISDLEAWCNIDFSDFNSNPMSCAKNLYVNNQLLTELVIPDSITSIGDYTFYGCGCLTSITIPNGVTSIGNSAFDNCSNLTSITIPSSITSIGAYAFENCTNLASITIPNSVTSIGDSAFFDCSNLTSITIPSSITSIGAYAFGYCSGLENVYISDLEAWCNIDFSDFNSNPMSCAKNLYVNNQLLTEVVIPDSITSIGDYTFYGCGCLTSITIPNGVTSIGAYAFGYCSGLENVYISDLEAWCNIDFSDSNANPMSCAKNLYVNNQLLTEVVIPDSITSIGDYTFYGCGYLTSVTIPESVTIIDKYAFYGCNNLSDIYYAGNKRKWLTISTNTSIANATIHYQNTTDKDKLGTNLLWSFDDGVLTISGTGDMPDWYLSSTFFPPWDTYKLDINTVIIENGVTNIGHYAFSNGYSNLTDVIIPDSVQSIGSHSFENCTSLTNVSIPGSVTTIGERAFSGCTGLTNITIPHGVGSMLHGGVFLGCSALTSVTMSNSITRIYDLAFDGCSNLRDVYYTGTETEWSAININSGNSNLTNATIHYQPTTDTGTFGDGLMWNFDHGVLTISGTGAIPDWSPIVSIPWYLYQRNITTVIIEDGITNIGDYTFYNCSNLTDITIPNSVTSIGNSAFYNCSNLASITIPSGITHIEDSTFSYCTKLKSITIPESVTSIGNDTFYACSSLSDITIPEGVTNIGDSVFSRCNHLRYITIPSSLTSIGSNAFEACTGLYTVYISDLEAWCNIDFSDSNANPMNHADNLYLNGQPLTEITIPEDTTSIGKYTFRNLKDLTRVTIPDTVTNIGDDAFYNCYNLRDVYYSGKGSEWLSINIGSNNTYLTNATIYCADKIDTGTFENDFMWSFDNGILTISGAGAMPDWAIDSHAPWYLYKTDITTVVMENDITHIGSYAFNGYNSLTNIMIPVGVTSIGDSAFSGCSSLTSVTIPKDVASIGNSAFSGCNNLLMLVHDSSCAHTYAVDNNITYEIILPISDLTVASSDGDNIVLTYTQPILNDEIYLYMLQDSEWVKTDKICADGQISIPKSEMSFSTEYQFKLNVIGGPNKGESNIAVFYNASDQCELLNKNDLSVTLSEYATAYAIAPETSKNATYEIYDKDGMKLDGNFVPLSIGENSFTIKVIAENGIDYSEHMIHIHLLSNEHDLLNAAELSSVVLSEYVTEYIISPEISTNATYEIYDKDNHKLTGNTLPVGIGENHFTIKVTAENETDYADYPVNIYLKSNKCELLNASTLSEFIATATHTLVPKISENASYEIYTKSGAKLESNSVSLDVGENEFMIKVIAENDIDSKTYTVTITRIPKLPDIRANQETGYYVFTPPLSYPLILSVNNAKAKIYYTTDGSEPTENSTLYNVNFIDIDEPVTIKARAVCDGYVDSDVKTITFYRAVAPSNVIIQSISGNSAVLRYDMPEGIQSLTVKYSTNRGGSWKESDEITNVKNVVEVTGLQQETEYMFKLVALYSGGYTLESNPIVGTTTYMTSSECKITKTLSPYGAQIDNTDKTITGARVMNSYDMLKLNVEVSDKAEWYVYNTADDARFNRNEIADKTISLNHEGDDNTAYIKVVAEDKVHSNTYKIVIYRQSKSEKPTASIKSEYVLDGTKIILTATGEIIKYTTDGTDPSEFNGIIYSGPIIIHEDTILKVSAKSNDKDEYSDVVILRYYVVDEIPIIKLDAPTDVKWKDNTSTAVWDQQNNDNGYTVQLYKDGNSYGDAVKVTETEFDFSDYITSTGDYSFTVTANGDNVYHSDSDASAPSAIYHYEKLKSYVVTFVNYDNTKLQGGMVAENTIPKYTGAIPSKLEDDCYTYTFSGWSPELSTVTEDAVYIAQFERTPRIYTVILNANGGEISENLTSYTYGMTVTLPIPTKEGYSFGGWYDNEAYSGTVVSVISNTETGDKTYYAKWTKNELTKYLITFVNYDNTELQSGKVEVNTIPEYNGETPIKPEDDFYTYAFSGWSPELKTVDDDMIYKAQFKAISKEYKYNIEYQDGKAYVTVPKAGEYSVIFAVYSENTLLRAEVKKVKFEDAGMKTVSLLESVDAKYKVKVMLWDSITGMQPLCPSAGNNL